MAVNKVIFGNDTLIDLTSDTVTASTLAMGVKAHNKSGILITGTMSGSGYKINMTTPDQELFGQDITITKDGQTVGTTSFDNEGNATYTVTSPGDYILIVVYDGKMTSIPVTVDDTNVEIRGVLNHEDWLTAGGLDPSDYADLDAVLADEKAIRQLMTVHNSVDYLVSFF